MNIFVRMQLTVYEFFKEEKTNFYRNMTTVDSSSTKEHQLVLKGKKLYSYLIEGINNGIISNAVGSSKIRRSSLFSGRSLWFVCSRCGRIFGKIHKWRIDGKFDRKLFNGTKDDGVSLQLNSFNRLIFKRDLFGRDVHLLHCRHKRRKLGGV